jgi:hypothetical protein
MFDNRSQSSPDRVVRLLTAGALVVALAVVAGILANGRGSALAGEPGGSAGPSPAPVVTPAPTETPSVEPEPTEEPEPQPTDEPEPTDAPEPSEPPRDAMPITVDLDVPAPHRVYVDIVDHAGVVADARSGPASDGVSVEYGELLVENIDERTLQLTWSDRPGDNALALYVWRDGDTVRLVVVQPPHDEDGDTFLNDRVLILELDEPVVADGLDAVIVEVLDAPAS